MNKKIWCWIVGVVVVVAVIIVVVAMSVGGKSAVVETHTTAAIAQQSLHELISSGTTQTCTFSIAGTATSSSMTGTLYTAAGSMYGDFVKTTVAGKVTTAHMIIASGEGYLWSDALSRGIKMPWSAANSTALINKYGSVDMEQPATYSCTSWTPDQSKFALPTNTQFIDVSKLIR
jgi:hypothetical protein